MKISFQSQGYKLSGHLFVAQNPQPLAFLLIQGWTGHQNVEAAKALAAQGFTSMTYDMHGNGDSEGDIAAFSRAEFIADAIIAYDYFKEQLNPDTAIGIVGSSFGSYTALLLSQARPVACLSLRVPANYPDEGYDSPQLPQIKSPELTAWRNTPHDYSGNYALAALHNFAGPVQLIEADRDEIIPHQAVQNYADAVANNEKLQYDTLRDAPHRLENSRLRVEYTELLLAWAKQSLAKI